MEETEENPEELLLQKHRKERKELQAKIQSIKKTSDKKKKKETLELITQLESELKVKQQSELDTLNETFKDLNCDSTELLPASTTNHQNQTPLIPVRQQSDRISKAQRRRNKKAENERENERRIAEQEIENESGPRNLETQAINKLLSERGLQLYLIDSDGDCLYKAISHQLQQTGRNLFTVDQLRLQTSIYMKNNKNDMIPFMIAENNEIMSDEAFQQYCNNITSSKVWGGQIELTALSNVLRCPIHVLQASAPVTILGEQFQGPPLIVTYHRYMYGLGAHYNSCKTKGQEENEVSLPLQ